MEILAEKDPQLWKIAKKRASFKEHLQSYIIVNGFFWAIWYMTDGHSDGRIPWPAWSTVSWGIWLAFDYFDAYHGDKNTMAKREYEKLKKEQERK